MPEVKYAQPKYYVLDANAGVPTYLARVHGFYGPAEIHQGNGQWKRSDEIAHQVTGFGGDIDYDGPITEEQARGRFPEAFTRR